MSLDFLEGAMQIALVWVVYFVVTTLMVGAAFKILDGSCGLRDTIGISVVGLWRSLGFAYALTIKPLASDGTAGRSIGVGSLAAVLDFAVLVIVLLLAFAIHLIEPSAVPQPGFTLADKTAIGVAAAAAVIVVSPWAMPLLYRRRSR